MGLCSGETLFLLEATQHSSAQQHYNIKYSAFPAGSPVDIPVPLLQEKMVVVYLVRMWVYFQVKIFLKDSLGRGLYFLNQISVQHFQDSSFLNFVTLRDEPFFENGGKKSLEFLNFGSRESKNQFRMVD